MLAESDPSAWQLSRTQQAANTHIHTQIHTEKQISGDTITSSSSERRCVCTQNMYSICTEALLHTFDPHTHTHTVFVLLTASPEFCLFTWRLHQQVHQLWRCLVRALMYGSLNLPVVLSVMLTVPVCVFFLCLYSLTERAQLLKNVFKKSTVSLYRSDSMQQNLLRKLHNIYFPFFLLFSNFCPPPFLSKHASWWRHVSLSTLDLSACSLVRGTHCTSSFLHWHILYLQSHSSFVMLRFSS